MKKLRLAVCGAGRRGSSLVKDVLCALDAVEIPAIAKGGASVEIPDFTRGAYKLRTPLDVIDL